MLSKARANIISRFIYLYRHEKMLKQEVFAAELGISRASLSLVEDGKRLPSLDLMLKLSDHSGVCVCSLLGRPCSHLHHVSFHEPVSQQEIVSAAEELLAIAGKRLIL